MLLNSLCVRFLTILFKSVQSIKHCTVPFNNMSAKATRSTVPTTRSGKKRMRDHIELPMRQSRQRRHDIACTLSLCHAPHPHEFYTAFPFATDDMHFQGKRELRTEFEQLLGINHVRVSYREHYTTHVTRLLVVQNSKPCTFVSSIVLHFASQEERTSWIDETGTSTDPGQPSLRMLSPQSTQYCRDNYDVSTTMSVGGAQERIYFLRFNDANDAIAISVYAVYL